MRIGAIKDLSLVDGPGTRLVIFFTGCIHNCPGCVDLTSNSKIKTMYGEKDIQDIDVGDKLWSPYGETIVDSLIFDEQECYEIELEDGTLLSVGENHLFIVDGKQILAKNLHEGDSLIK